MSNVICSVDGCNEPWNDVTLNNNLCESHYSECNNIGVNSTEFVKAKNKEIEEAKKPKKCGVEWCGNDAVKINSEELCKQHDEEYMSDKTCYNPEEFITKCNAKKITRQQAVAKCDVIGCDNDVFISTSKYGVCYSHASSHYLELRGDIIESFIARINHNCKATNEGGAPFTCCINGCGQSSVAFQFNKSICHSHFYDFKNHAREYNEELEWYVLDVNARNYVVRALVASEKAKEQSRKEIQERVDKAALETKERLERESAGKYIMPVTVKLSESTFEHFVNHKFQDLRNFVVPVNVTIGETATIPESTFMPSAIQPDRIKELQRLLSQRPKEQKQCKHCTNAIHVGQKCCSEHMEEDTSKAKCDVLLCNNGAPDDTTCGDCHNDYLASDIDRYEKWTQSLLTPGELEFLRKEVVTMAQNKMTQILTDDGKEAAKRLAGKQFVKLVREPLAAAIARGINPNDEGLRQRASEFLRSDLGEVFMGGFLSLGLEMAPSVSGGVNKEIARELRIEAMANGGDQLLDVVMGPLRAVVSSFVQGEIPAALEQVSHNVTKVEISEAEVEQPQESKVNR